MDQPPSYPDSLNPGNPYSSEIPRLEAELVPLRRWSPLVPTDTPIPPDIWQIHVKRYELEKRLKEARQQYKSWERQNRSRRNLPPRLPADADFGDHAWLLVETVVQGLPPLKGAVQVGRRSADVSWKVRLPISVLSGLAGVVIMTPAGTAPALWPLAGETLAMLVGSATPLVAFTLGGAIGWIILPLVGGLFVLAIYLAVIAALVAATGAILVVVYDIVALFAGWPTIY